MIGRRDISHASVAHHHGGERPEIGLERDQDANEASEGNGVEEDVPQDDALLTMIVRGRGCHDVMRVGLRPSCSDEMRCRLPNNTLDAVSEPSTATGSLRDPTTI
jgi:hypothetical protein